MMRSMFSGVSGLRAHQTKMDVIGNNIANVNTVGFKSSRVTFKEVFTQTISGASAANAATGRGGVNPQQIGLGVNVGAIDSIMTQGAAQRTDVTTDLMIQGDSFFIVSDANGTYFTRNGSMYKDEEGNIALSGSDGLLVNGWYAIPENDENGMPTGDYVINKGNVGPIQISGQYEYIEPSITSRINFDGNLNGKTDDIKESSITFYDSLGNSYSMDVQFKMVKTTPPAGFPVDANTGTAWTVSISNAIYPDGDKTKPIYLNFGTTTPAGVPGTGSGFPTDVKNVALGTPAPIAPSYVDVGNIAFGLTGKVVTQTGAGGDLTIPYMTGFDLILDATQMGGALMPAAKLGDATANTGISIDLSQLTQYDIVANASSKTIDGSAAGTLDRFSIGPDGIIMGSYSNNETRPIAQIAVASFTNPSGLEKMGSNLYAATANSGEYSPNEAYAIQDLGGSFIIGSLEMSNVDLSSEFTEMITTQRGFQANSRIITTSDELLQELVNLKR